MIIMIVPDTATDTYSLPDTSVFSETTLTGLTQITKSWFNYFWKHRTKNKHDRIKPIHNFLIKQKVFELCYSSDVEKLHFL